MGGITKVADMMTDGAAVRMLTRISQTTASTTDLFDVRSQFSSGTLPLTVTEHAESAKLRARVLVTGGAESDPELFYGPFLQLGSYLKIGPPAMQLFIDIVTDPWTWIPFTSGGAIAAKAIRVGARVRGLTQTGREALLIKALIGTADEGTKGIEVVNQIRKTLDAAGRVVGADRKTLIDVARRGDKEFAKLVKEAVKSGDLADEFKPLLEAMARDQPALAKLIDNMRELKKRNLVIGTSKAPGEVLGRTAKELRARGQAPPFVRVVKPDFKHPLNLAKQLIGFGFRGEEFWVPFSAREFGTKGKGIRGAKKAGVGPVGERELVAGQTVREDALFMQQHQMAVLGIPLDSAAILHVDTGLVNQDAVNAIFKLLPRSKRTAADREKIAAKLLEDGNAFVRATDDLVAAEQSGRLNEILELGRAFGVPHGPQLETFETRISQLRRWYTAFNLTGIKLAMEAGDAGLAIHARVAGVDLIANRHFHAATEVIEKHYENLDVAGEVAWVLRFRREQPELWERRLVKGETRTFLKKEPTEGLLANRLKDSVEHGTGQLRDALMVNGIPEEIIEMTADIARGLDMMGSAQFSDLFAAKIFLGGYWTRNVKEITKKGKKFFRGARAEQMHLLVEDLLSGAADDALATVSKDLATMLKTFAKRVKQGTLTPLKARKLADDAAAAMEEAGLIVYEKNSLSSFAHWQSAMGRASASNMIVRDFGEIAGDLTWSDLPSKHKKLFSAEDVKGLKNFYTRGDAPPKRFQGTLFHKMDLVGNSDITAIQGVPELFEQVAKAEVERLGAAAAKGTRLSQKGVREIRRGVGEGLDGQTSVTLENGHEIKLVHKDFPGEEIKFDKNWMTEAGPEVPHGIQEYKKIETLLRHKATAEVSKAKTAAKRLLAESEGRVAAGKAEVGLEARAAREASAKAAAEKGPNETIWVRADYAARLSDTLKAWTRGGSESAEFMRRYDELNYAFKSVKLGMDIFHYNVLAISQFVGVGPVNFMRLLVDPNGRLLPGAAEGAFGSPAGRAAVASKEFRAVRAGTAVKAVAGAVAGAVTGAGFTDNPLQILAFSMVGGVYGAALGTAKLNSVWAHKFTMNPQNSDSLLWMAKGLWTGRPDDRAIGGAERLMRKLAKTMARSGAPGVGASNLVAHGLEVFSRELWETLHNGSKHFYFATRWGQLAPKLKASAEFKALSVVKQQAALENLARELMQTSNNAFGGQNWATVLEHPRYQVFARRVLLAPDWTTSRLQIVGNIFLNMNTPQRAVVGAVMGQAMEATEYGFNVDEMPWRGAIFGAIGAPILGAWSARAQGRMRATGKVLRKEASKQVFSALLGGYAFMNALNYAFTGHYMWDNDEGKNLSIELPGESTLGGKRYVAIGKSYEEAFEWAGISHKKHFAVPIAGRLRSKASIPVGAVISVIDNKGFFGEIFSVDDTPLSFGTKVSEFVLNTATPIFLTFPLQTAQRAFTEQGINAGDISQAAIRMLGIQGGRGRRGTTQSDLFNAFPRLQQPSPVRTNPLVRNF